MKHRTVEERTGAPCADEMNSAVDRLEDMPVWLQTLVRGLSDAQLHWKPGPEPDAFSVAEHIHHLRDIEVAGYSRRLHRVLSELEPHLPDIDGRRLAIERR